MKSITKSMGVSVIARVVTLVTGLVVQREILLAYGSTFNGLTSSIAQIMSYLVLLEAGLGTASIQALYQPLAQNNWQGVSGIITATGSEYRKITTTFLSALGAIALLYPFLVTDQVDYWVSSLMMLIIGGSYVVSYIFGGKYKALLMADRKIYILYCLDIITITLSCVLRIWALRAGYNLVIVQFINLLCAVLKNAGYVLYVRKRYSHIDYQAAPDYKAVSKRWSVLVHSIAGIVVNHTDVMILTIFSTLKLVSVYNVYNMVFGQLSTLIQTTFSQAPQASFGRILNRSKEEFKKLFHMYEWLFNMLLFSVCTIALVMILPFVTIYTHGVDDINYIDTILPILFVLILLMNQIRTPAVIAINVVGAFKETQMGAILEAVINLTVSMALFFLTDLKLYGLLIGTVCSYLYRTFDVIWYTYRKIIQERIYPFLVTFGVNAAVMAGLYMLFCVVYPANCTTLMSLVMQAAMYAVVIVVAFVAVNILLNIQQFRSAIHLVRRFVSRKKEAKGEAV